MQLVKDENDEKTGITRVTIRVGGVNAEQLLGVIERAEKLEEEKKALADDLKELFAEAKGNGFDVPTLKAILKRRKTEVSILDEREAMLHTYMHALGMLPLFEEVN